MEILSCLAIFCLFIVFIVLFSTKYIQFTYKRIYVNPKRELDTVLANRAVPQKWKKWGKRACLRRLGRLEKFVRQDRFLSPTEKKEQLEELSDIQAEWALHSAAFFAADKRRGKAEPNMHV